MAHVIVQPLFYRREITREFHGLTSSSSRNSTFLKICSYCLPSTRKLFRDKFSNWKPDQNYCSSDGAIICQPVSSLPSRKGFLFSPAILPHCLSQGSVLLLVCFMLMVSCVFILKIVLQPFTFQLSTQQAVARQH